MQGSCAICSNFENLKKLPKKLESQPTFDFLSYN